MTRDEQGISKSRPWSLRESKAANISFRSIVRQRVQKRGLSFAPRSWSFRTRKGSKRTDQFNSGSRCGSECVVAAEKNIGNCCPPHCVLGAHAASATECPRHDRHSIARNLRCLFFRLILLRATVAVSPQLHPATKLRITVGQLRLAHFVCIGYKNGSRLSHSGRFPSSFPRRCANVDAFENLVSVASVAFTAQRLSPWASMCRHAQEQTSTGKHQEPTLCGCAQEYGAKVWAPKPAEIWRFAQQRGCHRVSTCAC